MNIKEGLFKVFDNERQSFLKVRRRRCLSFFSPNHHKNMSASGIADHFTAVPRRQRSLPS